MGSISHGYMDTWKLVYHEPHSALILVGTATANERVGKSAGTPDFATITAVSLAAGRPIGR